MYALQSFAPPLVDIMGKEHFLAIYLSGAVVSSMSSYVYKVSQSVKKSEKYVPTKNSSNHLFSNFFSKTSKTIAFTKFLRKKYERISAISIALCTLFSRQKDFVKSTL